MHGALVTTARFIASNVVPWLQAPSPEKAIAMATCRPHPAVDLGGQRRAHRDRRAGADDAVGAEHALVDIGDVHRAALALAQAVLAAPDLLHHPVHVAALGEAMAVAAMGGDDLVALGQMLAHADGDGFLTAIEVREAGDLAGLDLVVETFLEFADHLHLPIGADQRLAVQLHGSILSWFGFATVCGIIGQRPSTDLAMIVLCTSLVPPKIVQARLLR